ncbi:gap junction delta-3 protein-like [Cyprinodon tularosa]|uniref:gap junction delta-3 protein-like n=1 Tax=Cyprinodon tularosa TaxID=77115 RepID=UPI0018E21F44|nr:gap junction delta-3 protein-like [Cyprinodon tularosa]XP_038152692.1 gap junction delta-3 protein-like [Cyprinodon tularosa]
MGEWDFLGGLFETLQAHSPMLGRFWLFLMLVFRIVILGTIASDLFEDEQNEFSCNTLQPGCKQVCYDMAFPISQYRFWVFHIVLIATPSMVFLMYATHHHNKKASRPKTARNKIQDIIEDRRLRRLYIVNVIFRLAAEVGFLVGQWWQYGFKVEAQFPCSRFPCPYTVDCFTSRPAEKTIFLLFYFAVGVLSALCSLAELFYGYTKWFCFSQEQLDQELCASQNLQNLEQDESDEKLEEKMSDSGGSSTGLKRGSVKKSSKKASGKKSKRGKYVSARTLMV